MADKKLPSKSSKPMTNETDAWRSNLKKLTETPLMQDVLDFMPGFVYSVFAHARTVQDSYYAMKIEYSWHNFLDAYQFGFYKLDLLSDEAFIVAYILGCATDIDTIRMTSRFPHFRDIIFWLHKYYGNVLNKWRAP